MSGTGYPDRSKQRSNDSPISLIANTAKSVQNFADSTREVLSAAQTGTAGKFKWSTNLLDMIESKSTNRGYKPYVYGDFVGSNSKFNIEDLNEDLRISVACHPDN